MLSFPLGETKIMRRIILATAALATLAAAAPAAAQHDMSKMPAMPAVYQGQADKPGAPVFQGLGGHKFSITTSSPESQAFFDQGVRLLFNFNHAEAIRSFREAARLDPT